MRSRLILKAGQRGTKKLCAECGERLLYVRYRYFQERRKRFKTVGLVVDEVLWVTLALKNDRLQSGDPYMSLWDDAPKNSRELFDYLVVLAGKMRTESYGEIAEGLGSRVGRRIAPLSLRRPLGFIRDKICREKGIPWLNALAVNGKTWLPGASFLPSGVAFGKDEEILWRGVVMAVFGYPWEYSIRGAY